jgi:hypothetical protein
MQEKPKKTLTIDLYDDGDIKVHDVVKDIDLRAITEPKVIEMMREHKITGLVCATIVFGNPCRWVKVGNQWYYKCW